MFTTTFSSSLVDDSSMLPVLTHNLFTSGGVKVLYTSFSSYESGSESTGGKIKLVIQNTGALEKKPYDRLI
jgi:hypothetical protein